MNKTITKVFLVVGILVVIFLAWQLVFNDGGILKTAYNGLANGINGQWVKVAGSGQTILPLWDSATSEDNGAGFDIGTGAN